MVKFFLCVLLLVPGMTYADQRTEKIEALMRAQGLLEMWQQQIDYGKVEGEKQSQGICGICKRPFPPGKDSCPKCETRASAADQSFNQREQFYVGALDMVYPRFCLCFCPFREVAPRREKEIYIRPDQAAYAAGQAVRA